MAIIEIPIDIANKKIKQQVTLDNVVYGLEFKYNKRYLAWTMNILDDQNNMIVSGIILYTNLKRRHNSFFFLQIASNGLLHMHGGKHFHSHSRTPC